MFSEENNVPRTLFEARKVAGSATYNSLFREKEKSFNEEPMKTFLFFLPQDFSFNATKVELKSSKEFKETTVSSLKNR